MLDKVADVVVGGVSDVGVAHVLGDDGDAIHVVGGVDVDGVVHIGGDVYVDVVRVGVYVGVVDVVVVGVDVVCVDVYVVIVGCCDGVGYFDGVDVVAVDVVVVDVDGVV